MQFEWDASKRLQNLDEHGVDFQDAALMFLGPVIESEDLRTDYGERRFRALGAVGNDFFMLAYTWRGETRRIISAWRVDEEGRRRYATILSRAP